MDRGTWKSNSGFILAAVGSAIGLGNIWRFSYVCHKNGGGSFLIPYFIALIVTGIPIMILEFAVGHKMIGSAPHSMHKINPKWEWLGWWPVIFVMFGINLFYTVVISWCALYALKSLQGLGGTLPWAIDEGAGFYFSQVFLRETGSVTNLGGVSWPILGATFVVWVLLWAICVHKVDKGVEVVSRIFMPLLLVLTCVLVFWGLTLEGAGEGIKSYLRPDWAKLGDAQVWRDAFGQIFFSLSIGFGIMMAYASYLPRKAKLVESAFITSCVNCFYSVFAGFAVFSILGYMAHAKGIGIEEVVKAGPGLCFAVYPEAIAMLPGGAVVQSVFGFLFFLTLVLAGLTSAMSIVEAFASAVVDKFGWRRFPVVTVACGLGFCGSIVFTTGAGTVWLDIFDHFLNNYGLVVVGLLECLLIGWLYTIDHLHLHLTDARQGAYPKLWDVWWEWSVRFVAPVVLLIILGWSIYEEVSAPYEGYPVPALILIGAGIVMITFLASGFFSVYTKHRGRAIDEYDEETG